MTYPGTLPVFMTTANGNRAHLHAVPAAADFAPSAPVPAQTAEAALLAAVAFDRDEAAFEALYHAHIGAVVSAARQICRNAAVAEEIAQRTFMTLWERAPRLATRAVRLRSWLLTVARNAAIDHLRAESPYVPLEAAGDMPATAEGPQDAAITNALYAELAPALALLPPEQLTVIELRYFAGLTFAAIAKGTGEALGTVKSRARLAIERLRAYIGE